MDDDAKVMIATIVMVGAIAITGIISSAFVDGAKHTAPAQVEVQK